MAWSTVTIGMVSAKTEDCGMSFLSKSSYKVRVKDLLSIALIILSLNFTFVSHTAFSFKNFKIPKKNK